MTEPLTFFPAYQARRREKIQREFVERFKAAETQQQLRDVTADYHLALAKIGIGPDAPDDTTPSVPPAANANPRPASIPAPRKLRRAGVLLAAVGGCFVLSWVYVFIAIRSSLSYLARRVHHRQNSA